MSPVKEMTASEFDNVLKEQEKLARKEKFKNDFPLYLMMLPGMIYLVCNNYIPMFGILLAFKRINYAVGIFKSPWVGLGNFEYLFKTKDAFIMIRNTLCYNAIWIVMDLCIAVFIALCMNEIAQRKIAKVIQPIICFPSMVSAVILSFLVYAFLSQSYGYFNATFFKDNPVQWYTTAAYWPVILTIVHIWQGAGQSSVIYMASIGGIDKGLYESARIDGATKREQIKYITLPLLKPMITMMLLLSIGRIFNSDFGLFYQVPLGNGMLYETTQTIDTFVYRALMISNNVGQSSAASVFQAIIGFALVMLSNALVRKINPENSLF